MSMIVLFPGGFKPPHQGHLDLALKYASEPQVDKVIILVGPGERDGIGRPQSIAIWNMLLAGNPKVEAKSTDVPSPLKAAYKYIETAPPGTYALASSTKGDDFARVQEFVNSHKPGAKYYRQGVNVVLLPLDSSPILYSKRSPEAQLRSGNKSANGQGISASVLRSDLAANDFEAFKTNYPRVDKNTVMSIYNLVNQKKKDISEIIFERAVLRTIVHNLLLEGGAAGQHDKVTCEICGIEVKCLAPRHLKCQHNMTLNEYKEKYPNSETISQSLKKQLSENNSFKKDEVKNKSKKTKLERYGNENYNNSAGWNNHDQLKDIMNKPEVKQKISEGVKKSYENNPGLRKIRSETIGLVGKRNFEKINKAKFDSGEWISPNDKIGYQGYLERVRVISEASYRNNFYSIPNANKRSREWHLDHKYSISQGYRSGIPEDLIGHWKNLEIIHHSINESKGYKSSITIQELKNFILESETDTRILLLCGGAAGHMAHPFDIESVKTGKDLVNIFKKTADFLKTNEVPVKIDGVNSSIRLANINGKREFALDRGSNKPLDVKGITTADLQDRFGEGHGMIRIGGKVLEIFNQALPSIQGELAKLGMIKNPNIILNIEYVEGQTNVQKYEKNFLAIHNLLEIEQVTPTKRATKEIPYSQAVLESMIKKLNVIANKSNFEIVGTIPAKPKAAPNFASSLSTNYEVVLEPNKKESKSLQQWLNQANNTKGQKLKLKDGKTVDALSKQVFLWINSGKPVIELIANPQDEKLAVDSFIIYLATIKLGDNILESLTSPIGDVKDQEGIVIRDTSINPKPYKITGSFITRGLESAFHK